MVTVVVDVEVKLDGQRGYFIPPSPTMENSLPQFLQESLRTSKVFIFVACVNSTTFQDNGFQRLISSSSFYPHVDPTMLDTSLGTQVAKMTVAEAAWVEVMPVVKVSLVVVLLRNTMGLKMRAWRWLFSSWPSWITTISLSASASVNSTPSLPFASLVCLFCSSSLAATSEACQGGN